MNKCISCESLIPPERIRLGLNGACLYRDDNLGLVACCSTSCYDEFILKSCKEHSNSDKLSRISSFLSLPKSIPFRRLRHWVLNLVFFRQPAGRPLTMKGWKKYD